MSKVHAVAILDRDAQLSIGDAVPASAIWVESFPRVRDANSWLLDDYRPRYYAGDNEAALVFANSDGRIIRCPKMGRTN